MKKFFTGRKIFIGLITVFLAIGLAVGSNIFYGRVGVPPVFQRFASDVSAFFGRGISAPARALQASQNSLGQLFNTFRENRDLQKRVDRITQQQIRIEDLTKENQELKKNLGLKGTMLDYETVPAVVVSRAPVSWQSEFVINKGLNANIKKNAPVLSDTGLVGKVVQVSNTSAKVLLISNIANSGDRFPVSMRLNPDNDDKNVNGIISGYDAQRNLLYMDQLTSDEDVEPGTNVQTSGLGGVLPKGIFVGTVERTESRSSGMAKRVYIKPAANLSNISTVLVITGVGNAK